MRIKNKIIVAGLVLLVAAGGLTYQQSLGRTPSASQTEEGFDEPELGEPIEQSFVHPRLVGLEEWQRPEGPWRVALQAGHWKAAEAPEELINLRTRTGTSGGGKSEWEVNLQIAQETKKLLESMAPGLVVEILPATIPENYYADAFVSIHADGNENSSISGFKVAAPRRDYSGLSDDLAAALDAEYDAATALVRDPNITRNMTGYYAFNWRRYSHSIHPKTPAAIVETGFLTNAYDRRTIVNNPRASAQGIAQGIVRFLEQHMHK